MTPRSLFLILIKILVIYIILTSFTLIPQFISAFFYIGAEDTKNTLVIIGFMLLMAFVYFLIIRYCLFRTDVIVDKLQLDKNFTEEKFELNIHRSTILKIAVIVIGGIVFVNALPEACRNVFVYIQQTFIINILDNPYAGWLIFSIVKILIGLFMMTHSNSIVNFIEKKRKKEKKDVSL